MVFAYARQRLLYKIMLFSKYGTDLLLLIQLCNRIIASHLVHPIYRNCKTIIVQFSSFNLAVQFHDLDEDAFSCWMCVRMYSVTIQATNTARSIFKQVASMVWSNCRAWVCSAEFSSVGLVRLPLRVLSQQVYEHMGYMFQHRFTLVLGTTQPQNPQGYISIAMHYEYSTGCRHGCVRIHYSFLSGTIALSVAFSVAGLERQSERGRERKWMADRRRKREVEHCRCFRFIPAQRMRPLRSNNHLERELGLM